MATNTAVATSFAGAKRNPAAPVNTGKQVKPVPTTTAYTASQATAPKTTITPGATMPNQAPVTMPGKTTPNLAPVNTTNPTTYVQSGGKDLNEILYLKKLYEGAGSNAGQQKYASNQAGQYYGNLDAATAAKVKGMNAQQLSDYINGLGSSAQAANVDQGNPTTGLIQDQYNMNLANLNQQAYDARNQADAVNMQNARALQEMMAGQGLGASGENITATLQQNAQRQGALNDINNQLSQNINQLGIDRARQLMDQYNMDQDRALQIAQLMGNYNGQRTLSGQQFDQNVLESNRNFDWGKAMDIAGLTGYYNNNPTMSREQYARDILESDRNYNRGVFESDRNYNRGVLESDRSYNLARSSGGGSGGGSGGTIKPPTQSQINDQLARAGLVTYNSSTGKWEATADKAALENFLLNYPGITNAQLNQAYSTYKIPKSSGSSGGLGSKIVNAAITDQGTLSPWLKILGGLLAPKK